MPGHLEVRRPDGLERIPLEGNQITVGRDPSNDVSLPDDLTASRRHAVLERLAAGWSISDLNSLNGTLVNGQPIHQGRPLYSGDEIEIGETLIVYHQEGPPH